MPDTEIDDSKLISNATAKANSLRLNSFLVWNFSKAVLYVKEWDDFHPMREWNDLENVSTRQDALNIIQNTPELWENMLHSIIDCLNGFLMNWTLEWRPLIDSFDLSTIIDSILNISLPFQWYIEREARNNAVLQAEIDMRWHENKSSYEEKMDTLKYNILAKIIINNRINKIIYAHILKRYYNEARLIEWLSNVNSVDEAKTIFDQISESCDFWNIFKSYSINTENINMDLCIPTEILNAFKEINSFFNWFDIDRLWSDIIEKWLINTVRQNKRKLAWQFSTPEQLARLLARSIIIDTRETVYDWCCWTWTIIKEVYNYKREGLNDDEIILSLYASDKFSFPIQIANINLSIPENRWRILQLFKEDIFKVKEWYNFIVYDPNTWDEINKEMPKAKYILSNLPFIQQEDFERFNPWTREKIKNYITSEYGNDYEIDWRSDLYAYIIIYLSSLVKDNWYIWIITSNSWLSSDWWVKFKKIILKKFFIEKIIISWKKKRFKNADVVTNILVLRRKSEEASEQQNIKFITLKESIYDLSNEQIDRVAQKILLNRTDELLFLNSYSLNEIRELESINISWNAMFSNVHFLQEISNYLVNLNWFFDIQRWQKTWCDQMFYINDASLIDSCYIKKTLKTTKWQKEYVIPLSDDTFICHDDIETLQSNWRNLTLNRINRFTNNIWSITTRQDRNWYDFPCNIEVDFVVNVNPDKIIAVYELGNKWYIWQRWLGLAVKPNNNKDLLLALLNSIIWLFFIEAAGFPRWLWALDLNSTKLKNMKMLNPSTLSDTQKNEIIAKFNRLKLRKIKEIPEELNMQDRIDFDRYVLECYSIVNNYDDIKTSLLQMYNVRQSVRD